MNLKRSRIALLSLIPMLGFFAACSTESESDMATPNTCSGYEFAVQKTGQVFLGTNEAGDQSQLVLSDTYPNEEPQAATIFANFAADQLIQEGIEFAQGSPQEFSGLGTLTLQSLSGENSASFCFEPAPGFTVDSRLAK